MGRQAIAEKVQPWLLDRFEDCAPQIVMQDFSI